MFITSTSIYGNQTTIDITSIPNYQNLTKDVMKVGFTQFRTRQNATGGSTTVTSVTFSYNSSTGIVTVGRINSPSSSDEGYNWILIVCPDGFITT